MASGKNIEVEIRAFITKQEYEKLLDFFNKNAEFVKQEFQETHYLDSSADLRIQKNSNTSKIWMKSGKIHDDSREEIEVYTDGENFEKLKKIFENIGLNTEIIWLRKRKQFNWDNIKICLDETKGYGYIIELEKMSTPELQGETLDLLKSKFQELEIAETPKEIFREKYNHYKENWRELIK